MFFKMHYFIFSSSLILGTLMAVSSNSWFIVWAGLEVNLMSMIPLIIIKLNSSLSEAAIKYFIPQAMASLLIIISSLVSLYTDTMNSFFLETQMITLALFIKAGMAPFHLWFPQISCELNWIQCLILFTWQKLAPLMILFFINSSLISLVAMISAIMGSVGGLNQNNMKILLSYSSISHAGWMSSSCFSNFKTWSFYYLSYVIISLNLIFIIHKNNISKISSISFLNKKNTSIMSIIISMFSLGGLPPLLGFYPKLMVIKALIFSKMFFLLSILLTSSLLSLFFYFRTITSVLNLMTPLNMKMNFKSTSFNSYELFSTIFLNIFFPSMILIAL